MQFQPIHGTSRQLRDLVEALELTFYAARHKPHLTIQDVVYVLTAEAEKDYISKNRR